MKDLSDNKNPVDKGSAQEDPSGNTSSSPNSEKRTAKANPQPTENPDEESRTTEFQSNEQRATVPGEENSIGNETDPDVASDASPAGTEPAPEPDLAAELETARKEAHENQDRFMRAQAELENYKRRTAKEHSESLKYALTPLVREVAGVMDNLERAVEHARQTQESSGEALIEGIEMVIKQMLEAFSRCGVTRIEAEDKPFDPNLHEALSVVETKEYPENQVVMVLQAGYLLHGRVIRPARVSVAKPPAPS